MHGYAPAMKEFGFRKSVAISAGPADLTSSAGYRRVFNPSARIDNSIPFGVIHVRETRWSAPVHILKSRMKPRVTHTEERLYWMSEATWAERERRPHEERGYGLELTEIDAPFGPIPSPGLTHWGSLVGIARAMQGRQVCTCDEGRVTSDCAQGRHRYIKDPIEVTYFAGVWVLPGTADA